MTRITVTEQPYAPSTMRWVAFWGENMDEADVWGEGETREAAVYDLLDNYESPEWDA